MGKITLSLFFRKSIYVGKTYKQYVSKRLSQADHKKRFVKFREAYTHHSLWSATEI